MKNKNNNIDDANIKNNDAKKSKVFSINPNSVIKSAKNGMFDAKYTQSVTQDKNCTCGECHDSHRHDIDDITTDTCNSEDECSCVDCHGHADKSDAHQHDEDGCSCGGSHEHATKDDLHQHDDNCSCGSSHKHTAKSDTHQHNDGNCSCGGSHDNKSTSAIVKNNDDNDSCSCSRCADTKVHLDADSHAHTFNKTQMLVTLSRIGIAVILLLLGKFLTLPNYYELMFFIPAYLIVGGEYIYKAAVNITKGKIFDENFLMTIASIGAFCIGEYLEGVLVMLLYLVGESLQDYAVDKSKRNISDMLNLKTPYAQKLVGGKIFQVATDDLAIGDLVVIANGEKFPVDGIVRSGESFADMSMLNGEYKPKHLTIGESTLAGSILKGDSVTIEVTKKFQDTAAAKIIELVENSQDKKPKTQQFITKFAKIYTPIVVIIAAIIAFIPPAFMGFAANFSDFVNKALVFLVISCPCALVISVPLGFFAGIGGASKRGILFKGGNYLEALNTIEIFAFDKTGTLTQGVFEVDTINTVNITKDELLRICAHAEAKSNHPIAASIRQAYSGDIDIKSITNYSEISGMGISLCLDGSDVLVGNAKLMDNNKIIYSDNASTIGTLLHIAKGGVYLGNITINDKLKPQAQQVISYLIKNNKKVVLLSGDRLMSVAACAKELGIDDYHGELLPQDKAEYISKLIDSGKKVAFVGDGLNDAPVLKLSTLGVCISGLNNDASVEASDLVLQDGNIGNLVTAIQSARKTRNIVNTNIAMSLISKVIIMILGLTILPYIWLALIADVGVSLIAVINSVRAMKTKQLLL